MRIVYFTPQPPSALTGGGLHCYANLRALCEVPGASVAYVGPPIDEHLDGLDGVRSLVSRRFAPRDKLVAAATGAATSLMGLYREWKRGHDEFDVAFIEFTKAGFAVADLRGSVTTIVSAHNVEADYMGQGSRGFSRLAARNVRRSEAISVGSCDHLLVLHRADLLRLKALYDVRDLEERAHLHPVCSMNSVAPLPYGARRKRIVIPGSLDQTYNVNGILAFLTECWPSLRGLDVQLVIAGRNPRPNLERTALRLGAEVIANPSSMLELVRDSRAVLVPDLGGTGMKLRVAEALSLGVPVIGTAPGMLGYEQIAEFGRVVPDVRSMIGAVSEVIGFPEIGEALAAGARRAWQTRYSFPAFSARLRDLFREWFGSDP